MKGRDLFQANEEKDLLYLLSSQKRVRQKNKLPQLGSQPLEADHSWH